MALSLPCLQTKRKLRRVFSASEDAKLKSLVAEFGENKWWVIANKMGTRNSRQCRDRWRSYLRPSIVDSPWTSEEDKLLLEKFKEFGPRWSVISHYMPQRSDISLKNRLKQLQSYPSPVVPQNPRIVYSFPTIQQNSIIIQQPFIYPYFLPPNTVINQNPIIFQNPLLVSNALIQQNPLND